MADDQQDKPKIIIDDDWKSQAQAEKEKLAQEVDKSGAAKPGQAAAGGAAGADERELPPANFATLISSLATQIFFALGGIEDPQTGRRYFDPPLAKHHIDMLSVIEEKTKGNLTEEEKKLLDQVLYETRMQFVQIAQRMAQM